MNETILEFAKAFSPSLATLIVDFAGVYFALKQHRENIELQKKQGLIIKQQELAMEIIDDITELEDAFMSMLMGFMTIPKSSYEKYFSHIEIEKAGQHCAMARLAILYENFDLVKKIKYYTGISDIYFSKELKNCFHKINNMSITFRECLDEMIDADFYDGNFPSNFTDEDIELNKTRRKEMNDFVANGDNYFEISRTIQEIKENLKKYIEVEKYEWDSSLGKEDEQTI